MAFPMQKKGRPCDIGTAFDTSALIGPTHRASNVGDPLDARDRYDCYGLLWTGK